MLPLARLPIRLRMALWFAALLLALVGATGIFLLSAIDDVLQEQVDAVLRLRASRVEREITTGDDDRLDLEDVQAGLLELAPLEEFSAPGIYVQVRDGTGTVIAASANLPRGELPVTDELIQVALDGDEGFETVPIDVEEVRVLAWPVDATGTVVGVIVVGQSLQLVEATREGVQRLVVIAAGVVMVVALAGAWWLTALALRPISDVTRVVQSIAATAQFEQRVEQPVADDEVGQLVVTFNEMLARLERTFAAQREFLADASHELRGPLMVIRGNLDLLRLGLPEEERRASVREASEEVDRMSRLAADLLFLAAADAEEAVDQEAARSFRAAHGRRRPRPPGSARLEPGRERAPLHAARRQCRAGAGPPRRRRRPARRRHRRGHPGRAPAAHLRAVLPGGPGSIAEQRRDRSRAGDRQERGGGARRSGRGLQHRGAGLGSGHQLHGLAAGSAGPGRLRDVVGERARPIALDGARWRDRAGHICIRSPAGR
jgi:HAMP domain-containing protein